MPWQARKESRTGVYHVMLRGINRQGKKKRYNHKLPETWHRLAPVVQTHWRDFVVINR